MRSKCGYGCGTIQAQGLFSGNFRPILNHKTSPGIVSDTSFPSKVAKVSMSKTPVRASLSPCPMFIFPEIGLSVEIGDKRNSGKRLAVVGEADWAFGCGSRSVSGAVLIAVQAKKPNTFPSAHDQLLTCLSIIRQLRFQENKINQTVRAFILTGISTRSCASLATEIFTVAHLQYRQQRAF